MGGLRKLKIDFFLINRNIPHEMSIENEVPKNYFRNSGHKAIVNVLFTSNWMEEKLKELIKSEQITLQQYNILRILKNSEAPLSTLRIREQMLDKMSDTSRIVERLLKKELVDKKISVTDKRLVDVTISKKGLQLLQRLEKITGRIDSIISNLNSAEVDTLNNLLDKVRDKQ